MDENDNIDVLLEASQDHHSAQLKPSQRQKVDQADIVFYIDDGFELFVKNMKASDNAHYKYIQMSETPNLRLLSLRKSGEIPHLAHGNSRIGNNDGHNHSGIDWHLWHNPDNAIVMLRKIRDELTKLRPAKQASYQERFELFNQHLVRYSYEKAEMMMKVLDSPFFVLHDGLQYFEEQYGLHSKGIILRHGQTYPSVKHMSELQKIRESQGVNIIIKEEQYSDRAIEALSGDEKFKVLVVDSLAQGSFSKHEDYISYADAITKRIFEGLKR